MSPKLHPQDAASAALPTDLKIQNRRQVLGVFRSGEVLTVNDVSSRTGISRQTAMKAIHFFVEKGILSSVGRGNSTSIGGKRPDMYQFRYERYLIAISLWPNMISFSLLNLRGETIERMASEIALPHSWDAVIAKIREFSQVVLGPRNLKRGAIYGVSVSTAGVVNYETGVLKYSSISPEWGVDIPLKKTVRMLFDEDIFIFAENAGKMAARSLLQQPDLHTKRILSIFTTWGISACMMVRGEILNGPDSLIGEIGHMIIDPNDHVQCGCGSYGCLEQLVGEARMVDFVKSLLPQYPESVLNAIPAEALHLNDIFAASAKADTLARRAVQRSAHYFSIALRNVTLVFNPEIIVFQGIYAHADSYFDQELRRFLDEFRYFSGLPFEIQYDKRPLAELNLKGAAYSLQDAFFKEPSLYLD